ncbi:hypothetical protein ACJX0J_042127, partial [Zea mays]
MPPGRLVGTRTHTDLDVLKRPGIKARFYIQLRKNCNHPDLLESQVDTTGLYSPVEKILEQCGKFQLFDRLLNFLFVQKHKCFRKRQKCWTLLNITLIQNAMEFAELMDTMEALMV